MGIRRNLLFPGPRKNLTALGENIRLARLRRRYSMVQVAERAGISRPTLQSIEKGNPNVAIGAYVKVLAVLGLDKDISLVANDDLLGRKIQDAGLIIKDRAPKTNVIKKTGVPFRAEAIPDKPQLRDGSKK